MFKIFAMPLLAITIITWNTTAWGLGENPICGSFHDPGSNTVLSGGGKNCNVLEYICTGGECIESCKSCGDGWTLRTGLAVPDFDCNFSTCTCTKECDTTPIDVVGWPGYRQFKYLNQTNCTCYTAYECAPNYSETESGVSCVIDFSTRNLSCSGCQADEPETPSCDAGKYLSDNNCATCTAGYRCPGDNNQYECTPGTYSDAGQESCTSCPSDYKNSEAGAASRDSCYTNVTRGCTRNNGSTPSGCASVTEWKECSCNGDTYKKFANNTTSGTTTNETCTKTPKTVTAKANHYVSGKTCPACSSYSSTYTKSDGGSIGSGSCYREFTRWGRQNDCSLTSDNVESYTCASSCTPGSCTYTMYLSGSTREDTCAPADCTKDVLSVSCYDGYYLDNNTKECKLCEQGNYCNGSVQKRCPEIESRPGKRGTSKPGSTSENECYVPNTEPLTAEDATGTYTCISDAYYQTGAH